jgi:hypothetical protein
MTRWLKLGLCGLFLVAASAQTALAQTPGPGMMRRGADGRLEMVQPPAAAPKPKDDEIQLPEPLAVELPAGAAQISPDAAPLRAVLAGASAGTLTVTHDAKQPLGVGLHRITFSAWAGPANSGTPQLNKSGMLFVLPHGQTPVGVTGTDHAIAGNTSVKIARDARGRVHMVWLDAGRKGHPSAVLYRRGVTDAAGDVTWEIAPLRLDDARTEAANAFVGLAVTEGAVHVVWQAGTIRYRRLRAGTDGWALEPIRDTGTRSDGGDVGPAVDATSDDEIHVISPQGGYGLSKDGGVRWLRGAVPIVGVRSKSASIAVDRQGNAHVAYTAIMRDPQRPSEQRASDGYWELQYVRRTAEGAWVDAQNVLAGIGPWAAPNDGSDVLVDWIRLAVDAGSTLHVVWHGTANTRIYGNDEPFYIRRAAAGADAWQPRWQAPLQIYKTDRVKERFAYAPSLAFDGETAVAVTFYEVMDRGREVGFDSVARIIRRGAADGPLIQLTRAVQVAVAAGKPELMLSTWFPAAAPRIYRANGRAWLDLLHAFDVDSSTKAPNLIVYQRVDLTEALGR